MRLGNLLDMSRLLDTTKKYNIKGAMNNSLCQKIKPLRMYCHQIIQNAITKALFIK